MGRPNLLNEEESFSAYYELFESPTPKSVREVAERVFNLKVSAMTVSRVTTQIKEHLIAKDATGQRYEAWKTSKRQRKSLFTKNADGSYSSGVESVQVFINRAKVKKLKGLADSLKRADDLFRFLEYKSPSNWTADDINRYLGTIESDHSKYSAMVELRRVEPRLITDVSKGFASPTDFKHVEVKRYDLFTDEIEKALEVMDRSGFEIPVTIIQAHIDFGCREGSVTYADEDRGGLLGIQWKNISLERQTADIFEGKVKKGILWKGCPSDLFGWDVTDRLKRLRGSVDEFNLGRGSYKLDSSGKYAFGMSYDALRAIYETFEATMKGVASNRQFDAITPHTARHLHVNLLHERSIPMEFIAGDAEGGFGPYGVGWTDLTTLKSRYFTLSLRTPLAQAAQKAAREKSPGLASGIMAQAKGKLAE